MRRGQAPCLGLGRILTTNAPELTGVMTEPIIAKTLSGIPPAWCIHQHRKDGHAYIKSISTFTRSFRGGPAALNDTISFGGAVADTEGVGILSPVCYGRLRSRSQRVARSPNCKPRAAREAYRQKPIAVGRQANGSAVSNICRKPSAGGRSGVSFAYLLGEEGGSFFSDNSVRH